MIRAIVNKDAAESENMFLLRFGLMPHNVKNKWDKIKFLKN
jgi:hypothetical protein